MEDLIGPAPPELAEELDGVGGDERVAEVARVIRWVGLDTLWILPVCWPATRCLLLSNIKCREAQYDDPQRIMMRTCDCVVYRCAAHLLTGTTLHSSFFSA